MTFFFFFFLRTQIVCVFEFGGGNLSQYQMLHLLYTDLKFWKSNIRESMGPKIQLCHTEFYSDYRYFCSRIKYINKKYHLKMIVFE